MLTSYARDEGWFSELDPGIGKRVRGVYTPDRAPGFEQFASRYSQAFGDALMVLSNFQYAYDAAYTIAYASAAAAAAGPITGKAIAAGMAQLVAPGPTIAIGPGEGAIQDATARLAMGERIDLQGLSGNLDFDREPASPRRRLRRSRCGASAKWAGSCSSWTRDKRTMRRAGRSSARSHARLPTARPRETERAPAHEARIPLVQRPALGIQESAWMGGHRQPRRANGPAWGCVLLGLAGCANVVGLDDFVHAGPGIAACPEAEVRIDADCVRAGVPETNCGHGFVADGHGGCEPVLPEDACAGTLARPGDTTCAALANCEQMCRRQHRARASGSCRCRFPAGGDGDSVAVRHVSDGIRSGDGKGDATIMWTWQ